MIPPDIAFAMLVNKTTAAYTSNAPAYMTYTENTHINVSAGIYKRNVNIDRSVAVRVADNYSIMRDLPNGGEETGEAFPILAYFDPISNSYPTYQANLKKIDIDLVRGDALTFPIPAPDPTVDMQTPYFTFWVPRYAPDSTDAAPHFLFDQTTRFDEYYPTEITVDPVSGLPSQIAFTYFPTTAHIHAVLDYSIIGGHWVITHGTFTSLQTAGLTFKTTAEITYQNIAFPDTPPDPRLAGTPTPTTAPSASASP